MKRVLAILLLLAMMLCLFTGCSKEKKPRKEGHRREKETTEEVTEVLTVETSTEAPATVPETEPETEAATETEAETTEAITEAITEEELTEAPKTESGAVKEDECPLDKKDPITDMFGDSEENYDFHVPQLNCETKDAEKINKEIDEFFGKEARDGFEADRDGHRPMFYEIDYKYHWYGDVLVLIAWRVTDNDFHEYRVYNIYRVTGNRMSNEGILRMLKVPKEEFLAGAAKGAEAFYRSYYPEETMGGESLYQEELDFTVSPENINFDMMMFPSKDGKLMLLSKIGSLIGSCYYEQIYEYIKP